MFVLYQCICDHPKWTQIKKDRLTQYLPFFFFFLLKCINPLCNAIYYIIICDTYRRHFPSIYNHHKMHYRYMRNTDRPHCLSTWNSVLNNSTRKQNITSCKYAYGDYMSALLCKKKDIQKWTSTWLFLPHPLLLWVMLLSCYFLLFSFFVFLSNLFVISLYKMNALLQLCFREAVQLEHARYSPSYILSTCMHKK